MREVTQQASAELSVEATDPGTVAIVIPCHNESRHISACLDSILASDYDIDLIKIYVVDGRSTDDTRSIVADYSRRYPRSVFLLDNPHRSTPHAMNIGIHKSSSEFVAIFSGHGIYPRGYVSTIVAGLIEHDADVCGGVCEMLPKADSLVGRSLAIATSHRFAVGNPEYRVGTSSVRRVRTVAFGVYRRSILELVGGVNPKLRRGQDRELNERISAAGGVIVLDPRIRVVYTVRSKLGDYTKWMYRGGYWVFYASRFTRTKLRAWRNYVPLCFVVGYPVAAAGVVAAAPRLTAAATIPLILYGVLNLYFSARVAIKCRDARYLPLMGIIFFAGHVAYGAGAFLGLCKSVILKKEFLCEHEPRMMSGSVTSR